MLHAVLSDIHGNLEALEAVLADVERHRPASIICLGDFVGYGASPNECMDRVRPLLECAVLGNHDAVASGRMRLSSFNNDAATAARWTAEQLSEANRRWLAELPYALPWRGVRVVHASPAEPEQWHYVLSPEDAEQELGAFDEDLCLIGHSHYPGAFVAEPGRAPRYTREPELRIESGRRSIVNVGSVGQPRDGDPRAAYLLFDDRDRSVRHVRLEYDVERAMQRITAAGLPHFLAERLRWGE